MIDTLIRHCLSCNRAIHGRVDKKFCSDHCRSAFNNQLNGHENNHMRKVDHRLRRNRRIIQQLLGRRQAGIFSHTTLSGMGFVFYYCTHSYPNRRGAMLYYCYEYGYLLLENERVQLIRAKKPATISEENPP